MSKMVCTIKFIALLILFVGISLTAHADLMIEYDSSVTKKENVMMTRGHEKIEFRRLILIRKDIIAFQLYVDDFLIKEVGLLPKEDIYYEADPDKKYYEKYPVTLLKKEYAQIKAGKILSSNGMSSIFFNSVEGNEKRSLIKPTKFEAKKSFWGHGAYGDWKATKYKLNYFKAGQEAGKEDVWIISPDETSAEYNSALTSIRERLNFYEGTDNEFTRLINMIRVLDGIIVKAEGDYLFMFGMYTDVSKTHDQLLRVIKVNKLDDDKFMYFDEDGKIRLADVSSSAQNALYQVHELKRRPSNALGAGFRPDKAEGLQFYPILKAILGLVFGLIMPVFMIFFILYGLFRVAVQGESFLPSNGYVCGVFATSITICLISFAQIMFTIPVLFDSYELQSITIVAAVIVIMWGMSMAENRNEDKFLKESDRYNRCPKCKVVVEKIAAECPKCKIRLD